MKVRPAVPSTSRDSARADCCLLGGIALAIVGMCHGTWYAVFAEHQALDRIGGSLASAFTQAADRDTASASIGLAEYRARKYVHDRQVDAHGH
jgi:hypothetical protein